MMRFFIKTHIVKKGETLKSIAELYNIPDVELLRYFHHQNSPKDSNHLGHQVVIGQEIFIPEQEDIENYALQRKNIAEKNKEKRKFHLKNSDFTPNLHFQNNCYKISITEFSEHKESGDTLEFEGEFQYKDNSPVLQYHKRNIRVINGQSDLKLYDLALEVLEKMYPVEYSIHPKTKQIESIANSKFLSSKWRDNRTKLLEKYTDSYSLKYIQWIDYAEKNHFIDFLKKDLFLQFLFAPYGKYQDGKMEKDLSFGTPSISYKNEMSMEILEHQIEIIQHSKSIDQFSTITAKYLLEPNHHLLDEGKIEIESSFYGDKKRLEIEIKKKGKQT